MNIRLRKMLVYLIVIIIAFYLLPLCISDTSSAMNILLLWIPVICFITSLIYGYKNGYDWIFPIIVTLLFIPTIFIFYNTSASFYILVYGIITVVGGLLGSFVAKKSSKKSSI